MTRKEAEKALAARLTPEFLATLVEAFLVVGSSDECVVWEFLGDCREIAGVPHDRDKWELPYTFEDDHIPGGAP